MQNIKTIELQNYITGFLLTKKPHLHVFEISKHLLYTTKPYYNFIDYCITKMANKESFNSLSVDDLEMKLDEHFCNQTVDILTLFTS